MLIYNQLKKLVFGNTLAKEVLGDNVDIDIDQKFIKLVPQEELGQSQAPKRENSSEAEDGELSSLRHIFDMSDDEISKIVAILPEQGNRVL